MSSLYTAPGHAGSALIPASAPVLTVGQRFPNANAEAYTRRRVAPRDGPAGADRSVVGRPGGVIESARSRFEEEKLQLEELIAGDRAADRAEAVADLQKRQAILRESYAVTSRIESLPLLDFLR